MKVILEGEERIVNTIVRENRVRVSRGQVSFSPADSIPTPEGVTEEDVKKMGDAIESMMEEIEAKNARIDDLMNENETLKAALAEKENAADAPENTDTKEGGETDTTEAPQEDTKDAPKVDTKEVEDAPDTYGKKSSRK